MPSILAAFLDSGCCVKKIALFADVQNLYYTVRQAHGCHFDYAALWADVSARGEIVEAYAYAIDRGDAKQQQFQQILRNLGFTVKLKPYIQRSDGSAKGDWDVGITIDVLDVAARVDEPFRREPRCCEKWRQVRRRTQVMASAGRVIPLPSPTTTAGAISRATLRAGPVFTRCGVIRRSFGMTKLLSSCLASRKNRRRRGRGRNGNLRLIRGGRLSWL